ncbi:MAG TPA: MAPEG family protein [Burkholderiales bacterium]|nr:MAPEG family protein [Burkholderiales bacterium]
MRTNTIGAKYLVVGVILAAFVAALVAVVRTTAASAHVAQGAPAALLQPVVALVVLTAIVLLMTVVYRNVALIRGAVSARYFRTFTAEMPAEWVERPTRTYMNLLELPVLFYVVCLLMLTTGRFDAVQVSLAWVFVITRYVHAFIYIGFNDVPLRFAAFLTGVFTLAVLWTRFAEQNLNGPLS